MGIIRDIFFGRPNSVVGVLTSPPATGTDLVRLPATGQTLDEARFSTLIDSGTLYGVQTLDEAMIWAAGVYRVTRREAISVPAVKRARDMIAGTLGSLPLRMHDQNNKVVDWSLLSQPEEGVSSTVTWTRVIDDLVFHGVAFLKVQALGWHGRPITVVRLDPETVTIRPDNKVYYSATGNGTALEYLPDDQIIRIDSPNDPLLVAGARAIRALGRLETAALNSATGIPPNDYFTPADGIDPATDAEIIAVLDAWKAARQTRSTGYVPAALDYHVNGFSPEQIQMAEAREFAITEIARLTGVDSEDLSVSTTSRTYQNSQDRRRSFLDLTVGPYMRAVEGALSMDTVTPRGFRVRFDTDDFVRADDLTTAQTDQILVTSGITTVNEVRERRGLEPLDEPAPATEPAHAEEPANAQ